MGMKGNPEVFLRNLDGIVQSICNPALTAHLVRIDTEATHPHASIYQADRTHFKVTRQTALIREAMTGEFDYSPCSNKITMESYPNLEFQKPPLPNEVLRSIYKLIPRLWVLCTQVVPGTHLVTTIYRGKPFWRVADIDGRHVAELRTENELAEVLAKVQACEGFDKSSVERFYREAWDTCVVYAASAAQGQSEAIH